MAIPKQVVDAHPTVQQNFDDLRQFLTALFGDREPKIRWGTKTLSWPGGTADLTGQTFNHGLGSTPVGVWFTGSDTHINSYYFTSATSTAVTFLAHCLTGIPALNSTDTVYWLAIG